MSIIHDLTKTAASKPGFHAVYSTEETVRRLTPEPQADMRRLSLRELRVGGSVTGDGLLHFSGAGEKTRLAVDVIAEASRVVAAGAKVVLIADAAQPVKDSAGQMHMVETQGGLFVAEPAPFVKISPATPATDAALPVFRSMVDRSLSIGGTPTLAFRTVISRRERHRWMDTQLDDALLSSIVQGIGRTVDEVLLTTIMNQVPAAFTVAAAAARGLRIDDLRGIVGRSGNGAGHRGDGVFCAANIPAEISADLDDTVVGAFHKSGVAIHEEVVLMAQRTNTDGDMAVTCLINIESLLPVTGALLPFWTVA